MRLNIRLGYRPSWCQSLRRMGNLESALISRKWMLQPVVIITHYHLVSMFLKEWEERKCIVFWSGYNQISIAEEDQPKTTFITEYRVFAFKRIPFSLTNAPIMFHRLMNHAFREFLRQFLEVFLDDLCVHSSWKEHLECLRKVFMKCCYYRISLDPQNSNFG